MSILSDFLLAAQREADNPTLPGPLNNLPAPVKRNLADSLTLINPGARIAAPLVDPVKKTLEYGGKALTGGLYAGLGQLQSTPLLRGDESEADQQARLANDPFMQAWLAYQAQNGNAIQKARAANEGAASGHEFQVGLANAVLDPTNLIPMPVGALGEAIKAARVEKNAGKLLAGTKQAALLADAAVEGGVDSAKNPLVSNMIKGLGSDGKRGLGPLRPDMSMELDRLVRGRADTLDNLYPEASAGDTTLADLITAHTGGEGNTIPSRAELLDQIVRGGDGAHDASLAESLRTPRYPRLGREEIPVDFAAPPSLPKAPDPWMQGSRIPKPFDLAGYEAEKAALAAQDAKIAEMRRLRDSPGAIQEALDGFKVKPQGIEYQSSPLELDTAAKQLAAKIPAAADRWAQPELATSIANAIGNTPPASIPATPLDKFLQVSSTVDGELPPSGSAFWAKRGLDPNGMPEVFDTARKAGLMGENADALLPGGMVDAPIRGDIKNTLVAIAYGRQKRAITAATNKHGDDLLSRAAEIISLDPEKLAEAERLVPGIGDQIDTLRTTISDSAPNDLFVAIRKAVKDLDVDRANQLVDLAPQYGVSSKQAQLALNSAASYSKPSAAALAGLGSSVNFTPPGLNAAIGLGAKALGTPYLGTGIVGAGIGGVAGATTGAAAGGALGALGTPEDRWAGFKEGAVQGAEGGAVLGAAIGAAGGAYGLSHLSPTAIKDLGKNAYGLALEAQGEAAKKSGKFLFTPKQLFGYWGNQTVSTARQWIQDGVWNKVVLQALQGKDATKELGTITEDIAKNLRLKGNDRLSTPVQDLLSMVGNPTKEIDLGVPLMTEIGKNDLSMTQSMGASTVLSALGGPTNLLGLGAAAIKGAVMPGWSRFLHTTNGAINRAFREAALVDEMGKLTGMGAEEFAKLGYDLSSIAPNELSAAKVASLHGATAGAMWQKVLDNALDMSQSRVKYLFGDYGKKGVIEQVVGTGVPFASWALRAYPVALDMAVQHPMVALGIYQYLKATSAGAGKNGRPGYTAGMVGLNSETPVVGAGVRSLLGGQKGDAYIDPVAGISPVGGSMFQPADETNPNPSLYQQVSETLGRGGLPGFNPLVTALSYILGLDYRAPTNLSRTQGLENSLGLVPGNVNIPDVGGAALRLARGKVSPLVAATELGAKVGAEGDAHPTVFDPVARRYGELVVDATGLSLDDPRNRAYLYDLAAGTGELYDQAKREVLISGAAKNAFSLTSPTSAVAQSESNKQARVAKAGIPVDYQLIQAARDQGTPAQVAALNQLNANYKEANPWAAAYDVGNPDEGRAMLMQDALARYTFRGRQYTPGSPAELQRVVQAGKDRAEGNRIQPKKK